MILNQGKAGRKLTDHLRAARSSASQRMRGTAIRAEPTPIASALCPSIIKTVTLRTPDTQNSLRPIAAIGRIQSQPLQEGLRQLKLRKQLLLSLKLRRVHTAPAAAQPHWMLEMQHLVVDDVLD